MDPSRNNMPLVFNANKHKPLIRTSDGGEHDYQDEVSSSMMVLAPSDAGGMGGAPSDPQMYNNMMEGMNNMMGPMMGGMMPGMGDPNMMMMAGNNLMMNNNMQMGMMGQMGASPSLLGQGPANMMAQQQMMQPPVKEVIRTKSLVLYPPPPGAPPRYTRERPPGCKTIFVGGIPENSTEDLMNEVFENCGPIQSIRISKKNFSHIRFENMESVDQAIFLSGYRMKIGDSDEKEDTGRLHVDFAQARDDKYEYECQQRALAREMRHIQEMQRLEEERLRPPSPAKIHHYSDHEGSQLLEKLKSEENFQPATASLVTWLEKGEVNRRTSNQFYAMVQKVHSQMLRINTERMAVDAEYEQYKIQYQQRLMTITGQISQVERVLVSAHKQKCWDHFTKAQRKSIDTWLKQAQDARKQSDAAASMNANEDMDMSSDDEGEPSPKKKAKNSQGLSKYNQNLEDENNSLKCQMEAFKNEVDMEKIQRVTEVDAKEKQIKALQNALQGMQQQLITQRASAAASAKAAQDAAAKAQTELRLDNSAEIDLTTDTEDKSPSFSTKDTKDEVSSSGLNMTEKEAQMVGLVCCFLHVHPNGATVDYLWSYLRQLINVRTREVEDLLDKLPSMFSQEIHGVGANIERRWVFLGLQRTGAATGGSLFA